MMDTYKLTVATLTAQTVGVAASELSQLLEYPRQRELGDLALPCFRFAKTQRRQPAAIASDVGDVLRASGKFAAVEVSGGYVNIRLERATAATEVVQSARADIDRFFSRRRLAGTSSGIDYSSPNIAKPFGVGHLRSTMIGQAITNLLQADGCHTVGINHLGDWGTQFGKTIVAYLKWGDEATVRRDPVKELFHLYVRFHEEAQTDPELDDEARVWFKRLEDGDERAVRLWQWFIDESRLAFDRTYALLGVHFDHTLGESFYNDKMQAVVDELRVRHLLVWSDGAEVVDLSAWNMPPCLIVKSDGATIYATRDLAAALYRHDQLGADSLLYVVGAEQNLHFAQVFKVLELMGRSWATDCRHVSFGMMKYNGERLSTRRGKVVYLEEVIDRAMAEARSIIESKNPGLPDRDAVARMVGIGAVVFNDLKTYRVHDVDFRWEEVLNFDGETGPYVQYTHARACSVLRRAADQGVRVDGDVSFVGVSDCEWDIVHLLLQANEVFERAVDELDPSLLARFALDLCHAFNRFYHDLPILVADSEGERWQRLALTDACRAALATSLHLLGLGTPERM